MIIKQEGLQKDIIFNDYSLNDGVNACSILLANSECDIRQNNTQNNTLRKVNAAYLQLRDKVWEDKLREHKDHLWNGKISTLQSMTLTKSNLHLQMAACQYSDILLKTTMNTLDYLSLLEGQAPVYHMFTSVIPITSRNELVLARIGEYSIQEKGILDIIGGSLNLDELEINTFRDIQNLTLQELEQETHLKVANDELCLLSFHIREFVAFFVFITYITDEQLGAFQASPEVSDLEYFHISDFRKFNNNEITADLDQFIRFALKVNINFSQLRVPYEI